MKLRILLLFMIIEIATKVGAQLSLKTDFIGKSPYWHKIDEDNREKVSNSKGSAIVYRASINVPFSVKVNENNRPSLWGISFGGAYVQLNNENFTDEMVSEIMDIQLGVYYLRPLNEKWSILANLGGGIFAPFTDFSGVRYKNVLGSVGAIFIRHLKPNLDIGGGLSINSTLGYPMVFLAFYLNWNYESKWSIGVSMMDGLKMGVGYDMTKQITLNFIFEATGQLALLEQDNEDKIFMHQCNVTGFRPEFKIGESFSMLLTAGISAARPAYYIERTLRGITFYDEYFFGISPYASAAIRIGL